MLLFAVVAAMSDIPQPEPDEATMAASTMTGSESSVAGARPNNGAGSEFVLSVVRYGPVAGSGEEVSLVLCRTTRRQPRQEPGSPGGRSPRHSRRAEEADAEVVAC